MAETTPTHGQRNDERSVEALRDIFAKAAARDEVLVHVLEDLARDIAQRLHLDDKPPEWATLHAVDKEIQITEHFVLTEQGLRGDLVIEVMPDQKFSVGMFVHETHKKTHEVSLLRERSQTVVIDPPEEKEREENREKFFQRFYANLESQVRDRVALPPT
jgi:hypothetical protein